MKKIRIEEKDLAQIIESFKREMLSTKGLPESINYKINPSVKAVGDQRAKIIFENEAYRRMWALVHYCSSEVGWYGSVKREGNIFTIKDVYLYPQLVSGATVEQDDEKEPAWREALTDEQYNTRRFQGHSHVNMGTAPSGVDEAFYKGILQNCRDFFIFGIFNKRKESYWKIYDVENNIMYENADIDVEFYCTDEDTWAAEQVEKYVERKKQPTYYQNGYSEENFADWYKSYYRGGNK